tara:strand:- start:2785 stop:3927 length:1143 start_codon:yes stop_codon:yes gene_type:complete
MGEQYTLKVVIDDSKIRELENRLNKLGGGSGGSSSGGGGSSGGISGMLGKLGGSGGNNKGMAKNMAKIGGVAIGIMGISKMMKQITGLIVQSSPMLQGMMKLFNTSLMMIFRPIGDFVGFFLRPIMIYFLRNIALPMYQLLAPPLRQWGSALGNLFVDFMRDPLGTLSQILLNWNWYDGIGMTKILGGFELLNKALGVLNIDLGGISLALSEAFTTALDLVVTGLTEAFAGITGFFTGASDAIILTLKPAWDGVVGFFTGSWAFVTATLQPAWDGLVGFFTSITEAFGNFVEWLKAIPFLGNLIFGNSNDGGNSTQVENGNSPGSTDPRGNNSNFGSNSASSSEMIVLIQGGLQLPGSYNDISPEALDTIQTVRRDTRYS